MTEIDPDLLVVARVAKANGHGDIFAPESIGNHERALMLASVESCDHCELIPMLTPVACFRWVVELLHDPNCPRVS